MHWSRVGTFPGEFGKNCSSPELVSHARFDNTVGVLLPGAVATAPVVVAVAMVKLNEIVLGLFRFALVFLQVVLT